MEKNYFVSPILENIRNRAYLQDLEFSHNFALEYMKSVLNRNVFPSEEAIKNLEVFLQELPAEPTKNFDVLEKLHRYGSPATVAQTGGRYFGFVNGGILPSALCTKWLTDVWDQNAGLYQMSPIASTLEQVCEDWLKDLLRFPSETVAGYVTGSSTATLCGLLAGRNHLYARAGYDVLKKGLRGAPELKVVLSAGAHSTIYKALSILGFGTEELTIVPMDEQGRMRPEALPEMDDRTLLILQAGNVNTGAFDDFQSIIPLANRVGAWVHVDGAFGLWAAASPNRRFLTKGVEMADSWSLDAHKTLNAPYDNGIILCKRKEALVESLRMSGSYITYNKNRDGMLYTPEMSRRSRGVDLWATMMGLGKNGVAELIDELHNKALYFSDLLREGGLTILNQVDFNQVLLSYGSSENTEELLKGIQASGICWMGGSRWNDAAAIRISVCSYRTTYKDILLSAKEILRIASMILKEA